MTAPSPIRRLLLLILAVGTLLAAGVACSGEDKTEESTGSTTGTTAAGGAVAAGAKKLTDCEYAKTLTSTVQKFGSEAVPLITTAATNPANAGKAFDDFDARIGQLIGELEGYNLDKDVAALNKDVVGAMKNLRGKVPAMRTAAQAGDTAKLTSTVTSALGDFQTDLEKLDKDHKDVTQRLDKCPTS